MKPTGIVRRIDDLGRVVMPKELRRTLRIREGDPLEIFVSGDSVMLKKYSPATGEIGEAAKDYAKTLAEVTGHIALVADTDAFVAVAGTPQREWLGRPLPDNWLEASQKSPSGIFEDMDEEMNNSRFVAFSSIVVNDETVGLVVLLSKDSASLGDLELKLVDTAAKFIGKQTR